ncbi:MAG TPA: hypothetical protein P5274_02915 [Candidatus Paceibacterota bacterium]|nr:hypothetical protein [Candidatus Paceibacterota bacterium]
MLVLVRPNKKEKKVMLKWMIKQSMIFGLVISLPRFFWPVTIIYAFVWAIFIIAFGVLLGVDCSNGLVILLSGLATIAFFQVMGSILFYLVGKAS